MTQKLPEQNSTKENPVLKIATGIPFKINIRMYKARNNWVCT